MKKRKLILTSLATLSSLCVVASCSGVEEQVDAIDVDLSLKTGNEVQYLKKIDAHNPGWRFNGNMSYTLNPQNLYAFSLLKGLNQENVRCDASMGNYGLAANVANSPINDGSNFDDYSMLAEACRGIKKYELEPYLILNGIPEYAQLTSYGAKPDYEKYYTAMYNFAKNVAEHNLCSNFETWNEPDLGNWSGEVSDMMKTNAVATKAVYDANPNATVSALGLAFASTWLNKINLGITNWESFIKEFSEQNAFPDAFAWHYYGSEFGEVENNADETADFLYQVKYLQDLITNKQDEYPQLKKMSQHATEYHPVATSCSEEETTSSVRAMFDCIKPLLNATDVTRAFWPMYLSDDFGVVNAYSHALTLSYNFLWVYGRMPVERVVDPTLPDGVGSLVSQDSKRGSVVIYNKTSELKEFNIKVKGFNFDVATTDVYKLSKEHKNYSSIHNEPYHVSHKEGLKDVIKLSLKENEAYYIEFNNSENMNELDIHPTTHKLIKKENYYEERGIKMPYADIHKNSLVAYASMAGNESGMGCVSSRLKTNSETLKIKYDTWGTFTNSENSALAVRVDFRTTEGTYENSIYYTLKDMKKEVVLPFGTEVAAREIINLENKDSGEFTVKLTNKAPKKWNGEIAVTYIIQDAGKDATAKFTIL